LLFVIRHTHTAEMCPGGSVRPDKEFVTKLEEQISKAGVTLIEGYLRYPSSRY
jgi:hypothetical protein